MEKCPHSHLDFAHNQNLNLFNWENFSSKADSKPVVYETLH